MDGGTGGIGRTGGMDRIGWKGGTGGRYRRGETS